MAGMNPAIRNMLILLVVALLVVAGGWMLMHQRPEIPAALQAMGGDFRLQSASGPVSLHDLRGKAVLVYFGYTHCPDACPMALGTMGAAMQQLDTDAGARVAGIFISLDPRRDTPAVLGEYAQFFDARIVGLTGTPKELDKVAAAWRVGYEVPDEPADAQYSVEHSTFVYLVSPEGRVANLFDEKSSPDEIAAALRRWLD